MENDHFLHAYYFDKDGKAKISDMQMDNEGYHWFHMCAMDSKTRKFLEKDMDPIITDAMLAEETRPRILAKDNGALIILRAMNLYEGEEPEDMISIRIWIDEKKIISTRRRDIKAIEDIIRFIEERKPIPGPCDFLIIITDRLFQRMEPFLIQLEENISKAEENLAADKRDEILEDAAFVRKRTAIFLRYITPQKVVLEELLKTNFKWLREEHKEHLAESLDRVTRYVEELYELRDRSQILNDEINNLHNRRLNDITYIFSVAATIFLPLSFLTGLMGINIGGMPGVESGSAFWIFTSLCIFIIAAQVIIFRKLKWF